ncbi:MAG: hypothetical protein JXO72_11865 [Vicinamibacteria bacterium]|nr:hypothetical protein [Vicinamibacteria bacterium]
MKMAGSIEGMSVDSTVCGGSREAIGINAFEYIRLDVRADRFRYFMAQQKWRLTGSGKTEQRIHGWSQATVMAARQ